MDYRRNYVPKRQRKLGYRIVVPFTLLLIVSVLMVYNHFQPKNEIVDNSQVICKMSHKETRNTIIQLEANREKEGIPNLQFSDYGQYGETLGLYQNPYSLTKRDPFNGKTVFLKNICTGEQTTYLMGLDLDTKIPLEYLEDGFYEVELLNGLQRSRLVSEHIIDDVIHTISRNGSSKKIKLLANRELFNFQDNVILKEHVFYLDVSSSEEKNDKYDLVLDPSGLTRYTDGETNYGNQYKGIVEADEMYDVALEVKNKLEEKGLKVLIPRDNKTPVNVFGSKGRIAKGYEAEAKYYVQLNLLYSGYKGDVGATMLYSNFSSNRLATSIMNSLTDKTSLKPSQYSSRNNIDGVYRTRLVDDMDFMNIIRETGGKFTGTGLHPDFVELSGFAEEYRKGMQVVVVEYGYLNDDDTYNTWLNEKDSIIQATYEGILAGIGIK